MSVIKLVICLAQSSKCPKAIAIAELVEVAIFFAMRSCEYSKTCSNGESKRTKILCVRNFTFFFGNITLSHTDPRLPLATFVLIEFEFQKNSERNEKVGMHRSNSELCPVQAALRLTNRIRLIPGDDNPSDRPVNLYLDNSGKRRFISSQMIRTKLRSAVAAMGVKRLGFNAEDIGCHSIRSGGAMAMKLAKVSSYTIMIVGRLKSTAFLAYIRKQVAEFSMDISSLMVTHGDFFTTPNIPINTQSEDSPMDYTTRIDGRTIHRGFFRPVEMDPLKEAAYP